MINIFIDTNIYIKLLTNPEEISFFNELKVLVKEKVVKLLVPEIVLLELVKQNRTAKHNFQKELNNLQKNIDEFSKSLWSEVRDIESKISNLILDERKNKVEMWNKNYTDLVEYITSAEVEYIEFTPIIMCNAEKRKISGKLVRANESSTQDAYNIECLISYLNSLEEDENAEFIICTNDIKDFSKDKRCENGFYKLHPIFECDFKNTKCLNSLENLMKYINYGFEYIEESKLGSIDIDGSNIIYDDISEDNYIQRYSECNNIYLDNLKKVFSKKIVYTQIELQKYRELLIKEIDALLIKCRKSKGWENRSELKLYQWLKNREEEYICLSKLSDLVLIRESLNEYLEIHLK